MVLYANYEEVSYTLEFGLKFQNHIPDNATSVVFTDEEAPDGVALTDLSEKQNGAVVGWLEGTTWKVSSQKAGQKIQFNEDCTGMFAGSYDKGVNMSIGDEYFHSKNLNVTSISFGNFIDTSKTTDMGYMFTDYKGSELDTSSLNTSNVTNMYSMFCYCSNLTVLDVNNFDTSKVTNMKYMFDSCSNLTTLDISNFNTSSVTGMSYMFDDCSNLTTLDISNFNTSKVTNMSYMFFECSSLTVLDVSNFNTSSVTDMSYMFFDCSSLTALNVSHFDTSKVTNMDTMFDNCSNLITLDVSSFDTSKVTNMGGMFGYCEKLITLDVSGFNTSKVTDIHRMFYVCSNLITLDVSGFDTSNVTDMSNMFQSCTSLTALDVSNWNTGKVTNMECMFMYCSNLTTLDLSSFNTSNVTDMSSMFYGWSRSQTIPDISSFNTSKVTDMSYMFGRCLSLIALDVSDFDTRKVADMSGMFFECKNLTTVLIGPEWSTSNVQNGKNMFDSASSLPNYDTNDVSQNKAYAGEGGYMTFNPKYNVPYTVHFEKNNSTVTGTMNDESFSAGEKKTLSKNMFKDTTGRYTFLSWNTKADGSGRSYTDEQVVQYLTKDSSITLYAQWDDAFAKYSHTANINNKGDVSGTYASNLATTDTVKIDGAKKLKVEVWVSTESVSYDWLELRDVNGTKLTKDANGTAIGSSGKLGGGRSSQKPAKSQVFYITGDTVQFYFKSDSSGNFYGYYAIVTQAE